MASLDEIISSIVSRDGRSTSGSTLIVANHLAQMKLFGIRQGVEFYPGQDDNNDTRKKFIETIAKNNQLDLYYDRMWDLMLTKGQILLYLRPTKNGSYKIYFYDNDSFEDYYDGNGELIETVIIYSYKQRTTFDSANNLRWIKLRITSEDIQQWDCDQKPSFDGDFNSSYQSTVMQNTLKFIPCVVVKNFSQGPGMHGCGDFEWLRTQIESHDKCTAAIDSNLEFFGTPSLVTTRSPSELTEAIEQDTPNLNKNRTLTSAGGWYGSQTGSSRKSDPFLYHARGVSGGVRVKRIVGNVQPEERFGYISPQPISPEHIQHARDMREAIHFALGGLDERGITSNATAYEMKSVYGRLAATAGKKCKQLYTHGICKLFEMALAAEEDLFKESLAAALKKNPHDITDDVVQQLMQSGKIPPNVFGLPPLGDREIKWRWTGPVFESSPDDQLKMSIRARNFQELGVRSLEALKTIFDNKTDKELEGMLAGGYPFRYIQSVGQSTQQMLGIYQQMLNLPDPQKPGAPLAMSMPITPLISKSIQTIYKELNYNERFDPVAAGDIPTYHVGGAEYANYLNGISNNGVGGNAAQLPSGTSAGNPISGLPTNPSPLSAAGLLPFPVSEFGFGQQQQSLAGSIQRGNELPEYAVGIPSAGSTITPSSQQWQSSVPAGESVLGNSVPSGIPIPPDLAVTADQPGSIWQQLFGGKPKPSKSPKK